MLCIAHSDSFHSLKNLGSKCNLATLVMFINDWLLCGVGDGSAKSTVYFFSHLEMWVIFFAVFKCTCCLCLSRTIK